MNEFDLKRRSLLLSAGGFGVSQILAQGASGAEASAQQGYLVGADEGENLVHFRDRGRISIKVSSSTGYDKFALGTQQVMAGTGIPTHRHLQMDEVFYVLEGSGLFVLNDVRHPFEKGGTIFIPKNAWHGFQNPDHELLLLWIVAPPGLEGFFRETCSPPGMPPKQLTKEQIREIARKYGTEFK